MNEPQTSNVTRAKAVFLDKDGTLIEDLPYNVDPARIRLTPRAEEGLRLLSGAGYALVVVSNQAGVGRGYFPEEALHPVVECLRLLLAEHGVELGGFYYCPHDPQSALPAYAATCSCRKPEPGLLLRAASERRFDLSQSWMIGDILDDIEAGRRAACKTILIDNGHETQWVLSGQRIPHYFSADLAEAARIILAADRPALSDHMPVPSPEEVSL
jgi:D-glycero-D-manno-heptose 1,7-bisphosphate phosphatase